jgi:hypothetical protein
VRVFDTAPVGDLDPFFVFKVFVVFKEMFDLLDRYAWPVYTIGRSHIPVRHLLLRIKGRAWSKPHHAAAALRVIVCRTSKPSNLGCSR